MRTVVRNSFARESITAEVVPARGRTCAFCGGVRASARRGQWLQRFSVEPDSGRTGLIADGRLFCSRECGEAYIDHPFDETRRYL